jgi:hypothetical protein
MLWLFKRGNGRMLHRTIRLFLWRDLPLDWSAYSYNVQRLENLPTNQMSEPRRRAPPPPTGIAPSTFPRSMRPPLDDPRITAMDEVCTCLPPIECILFLTVRNSTMTRTIHPDCLPLVSGVAAFGRSVTSPVFGNRVYGAFLICSVMKPAAVGPADVPMTSHSKTQEKHSNRPKQRNSPWRRFIFWVGGQWIGLRLRCCDAGLFDVKSVLCGCDESSGPEPRSL